MAHLARPVSGLGSIAIYESDDLMYALLREWLTGAGYSVNSAAVTSESSAGARLVIVSVAMAKEEGDALIRAVRLIYRGTPIIALSSQARSGLSSAGAAARALGVARVMAKPLRRNELLAAIEGVIGPPPVPLAADPDRGVPAQ
jgi:DNA-binding response OmpR family regulator